MTLRELIEWLMNQKYKDQEDVNDPQINKVKAKRAGALEIDPGMRLNYFPVEPNPLAPTYLNPIHKAQPVRIQRRGTMPLPNMTGWEGLLYDLDNPDSGKKF